MSSDEEAPPTPSSEEDVPPTEVNEEDTPTSPIDEEEAPKGPPQFPKSDWGFAFGPEKRYWIRVGSSWKLVRTNTCTWSEIGIPEPAWVAFKHANGFFIGGGDQDGSPQVVHNWNKGWRELNLYT
jgi:hypothetical protein